MINLKQEVVAAEKRIRSHVRITPLDHSFYLSSLAECHAYLKLENLQHTGSFKVRGAINKLLSLTPLQRGGRIVAASTGNHGLAVAYGLKKLGLKGTIFLPATVCSQKLQMLRNYEVEIKFWGTDCQEAENQARLEAEKGQGIYLSPYNDLKVMAGQGTIAIELLEQMESVDTILVSVGGGGLISGIAAYVKERSKQVQIIACLPKNSPVMYDSVKAGAIVDSEVLPTLSDATSGGIETDSLTFEPCARYVDDWILVSEGEIKKGIKLIFEHHRYVIEGAAGVVVASLLKEKERLKGKKVALVICGGNIDLGKFKELIS